MGNRSGSIDFDPAAEYYDRTRALPLAVHRAVIEVLLEELRGRGPCLEIGVGTGRIALDLHRGGVPMAGVDLSPAMLRKLVEKTAGTPPFPLAVADATALPFPAAAFEAALVCHVLHLIPPWQLAVEELVRVLRPGGVLVVESPERPLGAAAEVSRHFWEAARRGGRRVPGLRDFSDLDRLLAGRAFTLRQLGPVVEATEHSLASVIGRLEAGIFAGCWDLGGDVRRSAASATREWGRARFGDLDAPVRSEQVIRWRVYEAPGRR